MHEGGQRNRADTDFRAALYDRYVSTFKGLNAEPSFAWWDHKYLPLLDDLDRAAPILEIGCGDGGLLCVPRAAWILARRRYRHLCEQVELARRRGVRAEVGDVFAFSRVKGTTQRDSGRRRLRTLFARRARAPGATAARGAAAWRTLARPDRQWRRPVPGPGDLWRLDAHDHLHATVARAATPSIRVSTWRSTRQGQSRSACAAKSTSRCGARSKPLASGPTHRDWANVRRSGPKTSSASRAKARVAARVGVVLGPIR